MTPSRPSREPAQERGIARRDAILAAAEAVFAEVGYERAGMREIAERAGASVSSVYHFFDGKEALALALAEEYVARIVAHTEATVAGIDASADSASAVRALIASSAAITASLPALDAIHDAVTRQPAGRTLADAMERALARSAEVFLGRFAPSLRAERRRIAATLVVTMVHAALERASALSERERTTLLALLADALLGIVRRPPERAEARRRGGTAPGGRATR